MVERLLVVSAVAPPRVAIRLEANGRAIVHGQILVMLGNARLAEDAARNLVLRKGVYAPTGRRLRAPRGRVGVPHYPD
jgi:hypothetical protein